jgi:phosphatidylethanolamine-binding protein (PEBP) family uncharacterized protein
MRAKPRVLAGQGADTTDKALGLKPRATKAQVLDSYKGHVLAEAALMGTFQR